MMGLGPLLWLVAGPAAAQLVVSSLLFEDQGFVDDAVANLVAFTLPSTHIMVHVSRGSRADAAKWDGGRVHVASDREETCSSCGMVSRMHAANVRRAASLGLSFSHVALFASSCRLFSGGGFLERHVARHNFSAIQTPGWARTALLGCGAMTPGKRAACERAWDSGYGGAWFDAPSLFGAAPDATWRDDAAAFEREHAVAFATHEGSYYARGAALAFAAWILDESPLGDAAVARAARVPPHLGIALEELLWPTFVLARKKTLGYDGGSAGLSLDVHGGAVDDRGDEQTAKSILALRLGRDRASCGAPASLKRWTCDSSNARARCPVSMRLLACLAAADAAPPPSPAEDQRRVLACAANQSAFFFARAAAKIPIDTKFLNLPECELLRTAEGRPFARGDALLDLAVEVDVWLAGYAADRAERRAALLGGLPDKEPEPPRRRARSRRRGRRQRRS